MINTHKIKMGEVSGIRYLMSPCHRHHVLGGIKSSRKWGMKYGVMNPKSKPKPKLACGFIVLNQMAMKPAVYTSRISTDIPLYETPGASFDGYLEDKPRVFRAIFPDKRRSQQLNKDEWRIQMLPINFLFLTVWPIVDMRIRCKTGGREYPSLVPQDISKVLELDIIRWELRGLDDVFKPSDFSLGVKGTLYPERRGTRTRHKGQLEMQINFILPPVLALVPNDVRKNVAESVLARLIENMKDKVNSSLLADYSAFKRETAMATKRNA